MRFLPIVGWIVVGTNSKTRNLKAKDFATRGQRVIKIFHRVIKKLHRRLRHLKRDIRDSRDIIKVPGSIGNVRYILTSGFLFYCWILIIILQIITQFIIFLIDLLFHCEWWSWIFIYEIYSSIRIIIFLCMKFLSRRNYFCVLCAMRVFFFFLIYL